MICDFPKWWSFLTYFGLNSHVNVTDALDFFAEVRMKVCKEEAVTSAFNLAYDKFQAKKDKAKTRQLLDLARRKVHRRINQWQIIVIISTSIQKNPDKVWADYFVDVKLHPHRRLSFSGWIKNIGPAVNTGGKAYFWNHEGSSYDSMYYVWKI